MGRSEIEQRIKAISDGPVMYGRLMAVIDAHVNYTEAANIEKIRELEAKLSECREALQEITEVHNWLWENCERGAIHHNDFFNRNANAQNIAKETLTKLNSK